MKEKENLMKDAIAQQNRSLVNFYYLKLRSRSNEQ